MYRDKKYYSFIEFQIKMPTYSYLSKIRIDFETLEKIICELLRVVLLCVVIAFFGVSRGIMMAILQFY